MELGVPEIKFLSTSTQNQSKKWFLCQWNKTFLHFLLNSLTDSQHFLKNLIQVIYVSSIEYKFKLILIFLKFPFSNVNRFLKATLLLKMIMVGDQVNEVKKHQLVEPAQSFWTHAEVFLTKWLPTPIINGMSLFSRHDF